MAPAVQEVRGISVAPSTLVKLDYPSEHCSSPTISENGNGHHEELPGKTGVVFEAAKPGGSSPECPHCSHCPSYNHEDPKCIPHTPGVDPLELRLDRKNGGPPPLTPHQKNRMRTLE